MAGEPGAADVARKIDVDKILGGERVEGTVTVEDLTYAYVGVPLRDAKAALVVARPTGLAADLWRPVMGRALLAALVAAGLAALLSIAIANRLVRPLRHVGDATARVAAGDLSQPVPVEGDDEVADLARLFNDMSDGLAEARRREHEFLASVSHEFRTPITSIRGYAEAITDGALEGSEAARVIESEASRLEKLVVDVMDLARFGGREFRLEKAETDLAGTLRDVVDGFSGRAGEAEVNLELEVAESLVVVTDGGRVAQVVGNLVENALRVTPKGGHIKIAAKKDAHVEIEVSDTGPGISPSDLPHVFERSYLWRRSRGVREVGTGLGLAIVRELATALGGKVEVESELGGGTTFRLLLPA